MIEQKTITPSQHTAPPRRFPWLVTIIVAIVVAAVVFRLLRTRMGRQGQPTIANGQDVVAVINNSGSLNTPAWTLTVKRDGSGTLTYHQTAETERFHHYTDKSFQVGTLESTQLATILTSIQDVSKVPDHDCLKPVSFATTTTITYQGKTSGDISCLSNEDEQVFQELKKVVMGMTEHI